MLPRPVSPRQKRLVPIARRTGSQGATSAAVAPSMTASVPARAPLTLPLTGASIRRTPRSASRAASRRGLGGVTGEGAEGGRARAGGAHGREVEDHVAALRALDQPRRAGGAEDDRLDDALVRQ